MARPRDKSRDQQLHLFHAPRMRLAWEELPPEIRKEVTCLLSQMSCEHARLKEATKRGGGNVNERKDQREPSQP